MAAAISEALGVKPELRKGGGGIFDITLDGTIIFSKHREGRYPEVAEIINTLSQPPAVNS